MEEFGSDEGGGIGVAEADFGEFSGLDGDAFIDSDVGALGGAEEDIAWGEGPCLESTSGVDAFVLVPEFGGEVDFAGDGILDGEPFLAGFLGDIEEAEDDGGAGSKPSDDADIAWFGE